jgi:hypothetical protein
MRGIRCYAVTNRASEGAARDSGLLHGFYLGDLLVDPVKGQVSVRAGFAHRAAIENEPQDYLARSNLGDALWDAEFETVTTDVTFSATV